MAHQKNKKTQSEQTTLSKQRGEGTLPPPEVHRADTMVRGVQPDARVAMEKEGDLGNQPSMTKGKNAPTLDQSRAPYTVEQMDALLHEAPKGIFPDTPGGGGATPLSADRDRFLAEMQERGHFGSLGEVRHWATAVFNALRERAIAVDDTMEVELASVVRVGEAPEVQREEMMWGGDFIRRFTMLLGYLKDWDAAAFRQRIASYAQVKQDDPWIDAAIDSFFGVLKPRVSQNYEPLQLGELQSSWERA